MVYHACTKAPLRTQLSARERASPWVVEERHAIARMTAVRTVRVVRPYPEQHGSRTERHIGQFFFLLSDDPAMIFDGWPRHRPEKKSSAPATEPAFGVECSSENTC